MVGADLQSLVAPHDQPSLAVLAVLEQSYVAGTALLPLAPLSVKLEEFGAHLEGLFFLLLVGLDLDLFGQANDGFKMDVGFLLVVILQGRASAWISPRWA